MKFDKKNLKFKQLKKNQLKKNQIDIEYKCIDQRVRMPDEPIFFPFLGT